jgi:branched-chain amino acid transport system substrate-binding protein
LHDFAVNFQKEFSTEADSIFVALGYDGGRLLFDAMKRAPDTSGAALRSALEGTRAFHGLTGTLSFAPGRDGHIPSKEVTVMVIRDGAAAAVKSVLPSRVPPP